MPSKNSRSPVLFVRVTKALHRRVRVQAAAEDCALGEVVEKAVLRYLDTREAVSLVKIAMRARDGDSADA